MRNKKRFGDYFKQDNTDWNRILELLQETEAVSNKAIEIGLSDKHLRVLLSADCDIERKIQNVYVINTSEKDMNWVYSLFEEKIDMPNWGKYAIIQMIEAGLDRDVIQEFTGYGDDVYESCKEYVEMILPEKDKKVVDSVLKMRKVYDVL